MEHSAIFEEQVALTPHDVRSKRGQIESIDAVLQEKLQTRLEEKCSRHGYVLPGTVKILSRSMGALEKGRFTGAILFHVQAEGRVLNPPDGQILEGEVIRKNKMGIYISYKDAIRVIIPRDLHIGDTEFDAVNIGDTIRVEVKKARFQVNDPFILGVGVFQGSVAKGKERPAPVANAAGAAPAEEGAEEGAEEEGEGAPATAAAAPALPPSPPGEAESEGEGEEEDEEEDEEDAGIVM